MQTIYYTTSRYLSRKENIVDLNEYRRKLAQVEEGSCVRQMWEEIPQSAPESSAPKPRRSRVRRQQGLILDLTASIGVLVMTLTFTLRILSM